MWFLLRPEYCSKVFTYMTTAAMQGVIVYNISIRKLSIVPQLSLVVFSIMVYSNRTESGKARFSFTSSDTTFHQRGKDEQTNQQDLIFHES